MEDILHNIKDIIAARGLTIVQLAKKTGFKTQNIYNMLSGRVNPGLNQLLKLAEAIEMEVIVVEKENYFRITKDGDIVNVDKIENGMSTRVFIIETSSLRREDVYEQIIKQISVLLISGTEVRVKL